MLPTSIPSSEAPSSSVASSVEGTTDTTLIPWGMKKLYLIELGFTANEIEEWYVCELEK
jgi:hypothetical protein